jgi:pilus assembly protein CpaB
MDLTHRFRASAPSGPRTGILAAPLRLRRSRRQIMGWVSLAASLGLAGLAAVMASAWLDAEANRRAVALALPEPRVRLFVATRDLAAGSLFEAGLAMPVDWPANALPRDARPILPPRFAGARLASAVAAGMPLLAGQFQPRGQVGSLSARLAPGMRAISLPPEAWAGLSDLLSPGDRVDLLYAVTFPDGRSASGLALADVRVLALGSRKEGDPGDADTREGPATLLLEVPAPAAETVALLAERATVSLALRGGGSAAPGALADVSDAPAAVDPARLLARLGPLLEPAAAAAAGQPPLPPAMPSTLPSLPAAPPLSAPKSGAHGVQVLRGNSIRGAAPMTVPAPPEAGAAP